MNKKLKNHGNAGNWIGVGTAIGAFFLGAPYLAIYLIYLSFVCEGDIKLMLLGER